MQQHEELKVAREKQIEDRRRCQAIENQREKEETEKIIKINLEAEEREKSEKLQKLCVIFLCAYYDSILINTVSPNTVFTCIWNTLT